MPFEFQIFIENYSQVLCLGQWMNLFGNWTLIWKFWCLVITLFFDRNSVSSVFSPLRDILLALSQWIMFFKSKFTFPFMSFMDLYAYSKLVSSAKWCMSEYVTTLYKSFMYIRKNRGPSTKPWRTSMSMERVSNILQCAGFFQWDMF